MRFRKIIILQILLTTCLTSCGSRELKIIDQHFETTGEKSGGKDDPYYTITLREQNNRKSVIEHYLSSSRFTIRNEILIREYGDIGFLFRCFIGGDISWRDRKIALCGQSLLNIYEKDSYTQSIERIEAGVFYHIKIKNHEIDSFTNSDYWIETSKGNLITKDIEELLTSSWTPLIKEVLSQVYSYTIVNNLPYIL